MVLLAKLEIYGDKKIPLKGFNPYSQQSNNTVELQPTVKFHCLITLVSLQPTVGLHCLITVVCLQPTVELHCLITAV